MVLIERCANRPELLLGPTQSPLHDRAIPLIRPVEWRARRAKRQFPRLAKCNLPPWPRRLARVGDRNDAPHGVGPRHDHYCDACPWSRLIGCLGCPSPATGDNRALPPDLIGCWREAIRYLNARSATSRIDPVTPGHLERADALRQCLLVSLV